MQLLPQSWAVMSVCLQFKQTVSDKIIMYHVIQPAWPATFADGAMHLS